MIRTYSELRKLRTFKERYEFLKLKGAVGQSTFGHDRYLNQILYHSSQWESVRDFVIVRDNGCDLAVPGYEITTSISVHHMNPITVDDLEGGDDKVFDPEFLICSSHETHMAIHYGADRLPKQLVVRRPGDTTLWR